MRFPMRDPEILKANEEIVRKFSRVEADLLLCREAGELFERLILGIEEAFDVPFVWLSLLRRPETGILRKILAKSDILRDRINNIAPASFFEIVPDGTDPVLAAGDLRAYYRLMPPDVKYLLRSLAVTPLTCRGLPIGSLNHGDASPNRYRPGMDTDSLGHLGKTVSEKLSLLLPATGSGITGH